MPVDPVYGQLITFSAEVDADQKFEQWIWVGVKKGDTVMSKASERGHPEAAREIADRNNIRSVLSKFSGRGKTRLLVPGKLRAATTVSVMPGDQPPRITDGYAKLSTVDRPQRTGLTIFDGFNPMVLEVPIRFENFQFGEGLQIERDIAKLERLAGRGDFEGTAVGPPPVVRVSVTGASGGVVPLISHNYQWSRQNPNAPKWRVQGVDWDAEPLRNDSGNRTRQLATVTLQQQVNVTVHPRAVAARHKSVVKRGKFYHVYNEGKKNEKWVYVRPASKKGRR